MGDILTPTDKGFPNGGSRGKDRAGEVAMMNRVSRVVQAGAAAVAFAGLQGCASPPPAIPVNHQRIVPLAAADVWRRVHQFLADQGISVVSEDLKAGLIDASRSAATPGGLTGLAQCGSQPLHPMRRQTLNLTVLIRPVPEGAEVTANAAFSETLASRRTSLTVACTSTGVLESAVLAVSGGQPMEAAVIPR
jgi:hypothetical protein